MPGLNVEDIQGIVTLTLSKYGKHMATDIASSITEYVMMSRLMDRYKTTTQGGKDFQFNLATAFGENARHTGMFAIDNTDVQDNVTQGTVPWRFTEYSYAFDTREEAFNSGDEEQIFDHIVMREQEEYGRFCELMEETWWSKTWCW